MRALWISLFLLGTLALGQGNPAAPAHPTAPAQDQDDDDKPVVSASGVAPDAPVLTIIGFCPDQPSRATPIDPNPKPTCQTVISRAQFEKLANAISPGMKPQIQRQLANAYPRLLVLAHDAEQRGLDKSARVAELQRFARLQILSQEVVRELEQEAAKVSDHEIEDYYRNNSPAFEQATLKRLFVPLRKQVESAPSQQTVNPAAEKSPQADSEDAMTREAGELRARALAGEDFATLQQHAYDAAGIKAPAPAPDLGPIRRIKLPPAQQAAFDMKVGEISQVITDASGHYIYKLVGKQLQPLPSVKEEIRSALQKQNTQQAMEKIQKSFTTEMNPEFFSAEPLQRDSKSDHPPAQPKP
jgi:parvulin-like peptidyl-prolyl isomerase